MRGAFILIVLFTSFELFGQEYQVIHIKGDITREESGELLKAGEKVSADQKIMFKSADAMAAVLDPKLGRYILKTQPNEKRSSDLIYIIKNTITPVRGGMSTRAGGINNAFDMKVYFAEASYVWGGNWISLRVSKAAFPMDENNFFFLRYTWNGEQINKKLGYEEDKLMMSKEEVFQVDGEGIDPLKASEFELFYYKSADEESEMIAEIDFTLISQESLLSVYNAFKDRSKYPFNDTADMFSNMYGKCDPVQVEFNIKNQ
jgi:hypothetical protein